MVGTLLRGQPHMKFKAFYYKVDSIQCEVIQIANWREMNLLYIGFFVLCGVCNVGVSGNVASDWEAKMQNFKRNFGLHELSRLAALNSLSNERKTRSLKSLRTPILNWITFCCSIKNPCHARVSSFVIGKCDCNCEKWHLYIKNADYSQRAC